MPIMLRRKSISFSLYSFCIFKKSFHKLRNRKNGEYSQFGDAKYKPPVDANREI